MKTPLFFVSCATCGARIRFFEESRLGQIIPCPKCGSMVLVEKSSATLTSEFISENVRMSESGTPDNFDNSVTTDLSPLAVSQESSVSDSVKTEDVDFESEFEFESDEKKQLHPKFLILGMCGIAVGVFLAGICVFWLMSSPPQEDHSPVLQLPSMEENEGSVGLVDEGTREDSSSEIKFSTEDASGNSTDTQNGDAISSDNENSDWDSDLSALAHPIEAEKTDGTFSEMMQSSLGKKISENLELSKKKIVETDISLENSQTLRDADSEVVSGGESISETLAPDELNEESRERVSSEEFSGQTESGSELTAEPILDSPEALKFNRRKRNRVYSGEDTASFLDFDGQLVQIGEDSEASGNDLSPEMNEVSDSPAPHSDERDFSEGDKLSEDGENTESSADEKVSETKTVPQLAVFRLAPPEVEYLSARMSGALAIPLESVSIADRPITALTQFAAQMSGERITADWKKLERLGVHKEMPVQLELGKTSLREVLDTGLYSINLGIISVGQNLRIVGWEAAQIARRAEEIGEKQIKKTLELEDLSATHASETSGQSGLNEIAKLIPQFVHPALWENADGLGKLTPNPAKNRINLFQYPSVIQEVELFCDKIRRARNMEVKNLPTLSNKLRNSLRDGTEIFDTEISSRYSCSERIRQAAVNCDLSNGTTMRQALMEIMRCVNAKIIFDEKSILRVPITSVIPDAEVPDFEGRKRDLPKSILEIPCVYRFEGVSLEEAVTDILKQTPLFCYPVSSDTFFLTTYDEAMRKMLVDFYPVGDLIKNSAAAGTLVNGILSTLYPKSWTRGGGAGSIYFDVPGKTLIVRQNPLVHYQIEMFLKRFRQTQNPNEKKDSGIKE
ncbi:MAG: hypothetical protein IJF17_06615 [Thermoguttaceae bacterium]|nr:hypothetical protein [Thermoguttaceae bacterium]